MLFQTCTKLTFGLSEVFIVTFIARNRINGVGSLFFRDRILRFGKNMPQSLKRFEQLQLCDYSNSLDGLRNTGSITFIKSENQCSIKLSDYPPGCHVNFNMFVMSLKIFLRLNFNRRFCRAAVGSLGCSLFLSKIRPLTLYFAQNECIM